MKTHKLHNYTTDKGAHYRTMSISYQVFGQKIHSAPIVVVNHALTGNSDLVSDDKGWWKEIVGENKLIDTSKYTILAFNIPGNGYDGFLIENYKDFTTKDIALIFHLTLIELKINKVFAIIGGSLGGGIAWEMASLFPSFSKYIIPIAADWKATDWIMGNCAVQESILLNSKKPLEDARKMSMLFYRTPMSFSEKFNRTKNKEKNVYNVLSWLDHHAKKIKNRFHIKAYLMMNHLLSTIDINQDGKTIEEVLSGIKSTIIQISVNSDLYFIPDENIKTKKILDELKITNEHHQIKSIHGHDAFLIEHQQITDFLSTIFKN